MSTNKSDAVSAGYGLGTIIAVALSYSHNASIGYAIVHGMLGWIYVAYRAIEHMR